MMAILYTMCLVGLIGIGMDPKSAPFIVGLLATFIGTITVWAYNKVRLVRGGFWKVITTPIQ